MSQENVDLILGAYEAFARRDVPAVLAILDENLVIVDRILPEEPTQGREGFLNQIAKIEEAFDDFEWVPERVVDVGDRVILEVLFRGRSRVGVPVELRFAQIWTIGEGKAVYLDNYHSWREATEAAGLSE